MILAENKPNTPPAIHSSKLQNERHPQLAKPAPIV